MNNNKHSFPEQPPVVLNGHHGGKTNIIVPNLSALKAKTAPERPNQPTTQPPVASPKAAPSDSATPQPDLTTRKEAQPHAHKVAKLGAAGENDPLPPQLDKDGQPKTRRIVFQAPTPPSARPIKETARQRGIEEMGKEFPVHASELEAEFDEGVQAARVRHLDDERALWERLENENEEVERRNLALEAQRAELEGERDQLIQPDKEQQLKLQESLAQACGTAGASVTRAHGVFDPQNVDALVVRNSMAMPLAALAGRLALPFVPSDETFGEKFGRVAEIGSGILFGTSMGLLAGFFEASAIQGLRPGTLVVCLIWMGLGVVVATEASHALVASAAHANELRWVGQSPKVWKAASLRTAFEAAVLLTIWSVVDGHGIMKGVSLFATNNGSSVNLLLPLAAGAAMVVAFVGCALWRGQRQGRLRGVTLKLQGVQEDELRARPEVAQAMAAVSRVSEIERQQRVVGERIEQTRQPFDGEIARLVTLVKEPRFDLHESDKRRLEKTHDEWFESFRDWKSFWRHLAGLVEPLRGKARSGVSGERVSRQSGSQSGLCDRIKGWWARRGR